MMGRSASSKLSVKTSGAADVPAPTLPGRQSVASEKRGPAVPNSVAIYGN